MKKTVFMVLASIFLISACGKEPLTPQTVSIVLEANPTTGYSWRIEQSEELFKIDSTYAGNKHAEGMVGVGGAETFTLTPLKSGKTEVTLTFARPWEKQEEADQLVYSFEIDRNLQVKMTNGYSTGIYEPILVPSSEIK